IGPETLQDVREATFPPRLLPPRDRGPDAAAPFLRPTAGRPPVHDSLPPGRHAPLATAHRFDSLGVSRASPGPSSGSVSPCAPSPTISGTDACSTGFARSADFWAVPAG